MDYDDTKVGQASNVISFDVAFNGGNDYGSYVSLSDYLLIASRMQGSQGIADAVVRAKASSLVVRLFSHS